ncbi:MAG: hypothetical protein ABI999_11860 [Acidobacteriota bacterium]
MTPKINLRKVSKIVLLATIAVSISWSVVASTGGYSIGEEGLLLQGSSNKASFILGEPVEMYFELNNGSKVSVKVPSGGVEVGSLKVLIAHGDELDFNEYFTSDWGRKVGHWINLEPGAKHSFSKFTILWNGLPNVSHLNEQAAKTALAGKVTTEYAFQEPGIFFVKGISFFGEDSKPIESKPVRIEIKAPEGEDLEVWNAIKGNKKIAYLMQYSAFGADRDEEKQQLTDQVEQIIAKYPQSIYSGYLKTNLEKFKANEAQRNEFYKNMKVGQKPQ